MRPIQLESEVGPDGVLHLEVPFGTAQANSRVIVTIEPLPRITDLQARDQPANEPTYGSCAGLGLEEPPDLPLQRQQQFLKRFRSLPFDSVAADVYGPVRAAMEAAGSPIGAHDLLIATIALSRQLTVVTANTGEFQHVPGLLVENRELPS